MHLGLYHEPVHTDGESYDTYGAYARYVLEFARHFERVTVFAPTTDAPTYFSGVSLAAGNVTVVPLPFFMTHAGAYRRYFAIRRAFRAHCGDLDVVNARGTAPLAHLLHGMTCDRGVPFIYHFASDPFEVIAASPKYRGLRGWFARLAYGCVFATQKRIMKSNYSFASGEALAQRLREVTPNVEGVITSSLQDDGYHERSDTCTGPTVRVLYVGYLRPEKGVDTLIDAIARMRDSGCDVELDVVGSGDIQPGLEKLASEAGLDEKVRFRGYVRMGPDLNALYDQADVFALPSLSEGSPKVVLEAMAHSLPVVATNVGNIPEMLADGGRGLLIASGDTTALAEGIERIIDDGDARRAFIADGYEFARGHSVEAFVGRMAAKARELVEQRRSAAS